MTWNSSSYFSKFYQSFGVKATLKLDENLNLERKSFDFPSYKNCVEEKDPEAESTKFTVICFLSARTLIETFFDSFN